MLLMQCHLVLLVERVRCAVVHRHYESMNFDLNVDREGSGPRHRVLGYP